MSRTFAIAGGGTGGHVIPAIAVARELRERGHDVLFIGTRSGMEARLVPEAGFDIDWIEIGGLNRVGVRQKLTTLLQLPVGIWKAWRMMRRRNAVAVFSVGGYVAGPVMIAAWLSGLPVVLMEPNAIPGMTARRSARLIERALVNFPEAAAYFPAGKAEVRGMPVRPEFFAVPPMRRGQELQVLITGGSRGSRTLNNAFRESWPLFRQPGLTVRFRHQSGREAHEELARDFAASGLSGEVVAFIADMPAAFAEADLIVSRSGAGTLSEIAAAGRSAILCPFPFAADDHQTRNAEAFVSAGAAKLVRDSEMTGARFHSEVAELAGQTGTLERMSEAARSLARPGAAERAASLLEELSENRSKSLENA